MIWQSNCFLNFWNGETCSSLQGSFCFSKVELRMYSRSLDGDNRQPFLKKSEFFVPGFPTDLLNSPLNFACGNRNSCLCPDTRGHPQIPRTGFGSSPSHWLWNQEGFSSGDLDFISTSHALPFGFLIPSELPDAAVCPHPPCFSIGYLTSPWGTSVSHNRRMISCWWCPWDGNCSKGQAVLQNYFNLSVTVLPPWWAPGLWLSGLADIPVLQEHCFSAAFPGVLWASSVDLLTHSSAL